MRALPFIEQDNGAFIDPLEILSGRFAAPPPERPPPPPLGMNMVPTPTFINNRNNPRGLGPGSLPPLVRACVRVLGCV